MSNQDLKMPEVTVHYAQTLDGRIATRTGHSQWISGEPSLRLAHQLRASHQAVMIGIGTVLADNPRLTVRLAAGRSPLRIVADSTLRTPMDAHVLSDGEAETLLATTERAPRIRVESVRHTGAGVLVVGQDGHGRVDLRELLMRLAALQVETLLIEGGRGLITSALRSGIVDRLIVCIAPKIVGAGIEAVGDLEILRLSDALVFAESTTSRLGEDLIFEGRVSRDGGRGDAETRRRGDGGNRDAETRGRGDAANSSLITHHSEPGTRNPEPVSALTTQYSTTSTAVWFPSPRRVELRQEPLPEVGSHDVRVRARASALSHGTEMLVYRGGVPPALELDLPTLRGSYGFPIKYGYASVGWVVEAGSEVQTLRQGDVVFVHHPHQTEYVVPAAMPVRLPPEVPWESGLFVANLETAVNVMLDAGPRLGERVVIFGQGVVGLLLTQLARRAGAGLVVAVDPLANRRQISLEVGADVVLPESHDVASEVRRLTGGTGADVVLEASGNSVALAQAIDSVAFQGTVVVCSWYGAKPVEVPLGGSFHRGRLRLVGSQVSSIDPVLQPRWSRERRIALVCDLLRHLQLAPLISHRIPFGRAAEAYELVDRHPEQVVQVTLTYGGSDV